MRIVGEWRYCDDGATRPVIHVKVQDVDGVNHSGRFLVDSGADRTVFSAYLLNELGFPTTPTTQDFVLEGIGGGSDFVVMRTVVELTDDRGGPARIRGEFAAFTDSSTTDLSILGRDVLNCFDLILSYPSKEVLLLAKNHYYRVERA
jgi:Aspartyl protease